MALGKKSGGTSAKVDVDFPDPPKLFMREPDRQQIFENWYAEYNRSILLKFEQLASALDNQTKS